MLVQRWKCSVGSGLSSELGGEDVKRLMAGGAEIGDLAKELEL